MTKSHPFDADPNEHRQQLCKCGKHVLDPIHVTDVKTMRGIARPTKVG